jgi:hypothetical protein
MYFSVCRCLCRKLYIYFYQILTNFNKLNIMSWQLKKIKSIHIFHILVFVRGESIPEGFNREWSASVNRRTDNTMTKRTITRKWSTMMYKIAKENVAITKQDRLSQHWDNCLCWVFQWRIMEDEECTFRDCLNAG